jgi:hypothetical protein
MTIAYYESLLQEFLSSLTPPSPATTTATDGLPPPDRQLPQLNETGKSYLYQLTCCRWLQSHSHLQRDVSKVTCRQCPQDGREDTPMPLLHQDTNLLETLAALSLWEEVCVGLVCGRSTPVYTTAARHLMQVLLKSPSGPSVAQILMSLNNVRE